MAFSRNTVRMAEEIRKLNTTVGVGSSYKMSQNERSPFVVLVTKRKILVCRPLEADVISESRAFTGPTHSRI